MGAKTENETVCIATKKQITLKTNYLLNLVCQRVSGSVIAKHLVKNQHCAWSYSMNMFTVLIWTNTDYLLKVWETIYITS